MARAVAVAPTNSEIAYAAAGRPGVVKSTDGGRTWTSMSKGLPHHGIHALAIDPTTPNTLYVGLDNLSSNSSYLGGVYKSLDGGANWTPTSLPGNISVYGLAVDPQTPTTIYAAFI